MIEYKNESDLQSLIDESVEYGVVKLNNDYKLSVDNKKIILGWKKSQKVISIKQEGIVIDGNNRKISLSLSQPITEDLALFEITEKAKGVKIQNIRIEIEYNGPASGRTLFAMSNLAKNVEIKQCKIKMVCNNQINMTAFFNNASMDTTLESGADELVISDSRIEMHSYAIDYNLPQTLCGIRNHLGNSVCLTNNYLFIQNRGNGSQQQVTGIYNSGRYARICNNNIKANGNHNIGKQLENCFATAFENRGDYLLLTGNNIVSEWGGQCIGLVNYADHVKVDGNKILSTHTIKGKAVCQYGRHGLIVNNIITSTSRNPRLIEIHAGDNVVQGNVADALMRNETISGCGVFVSGDNQQRLQYILIKGNNIRGVADAGICLMDCEQSAVTDNIIEGLIARSHFVAVIDTNKKNIIKDNFHESGFQSDENAALENLNDSRIVSIY